jgi:L-methionine (R)-S-oxide reductase
MSNRHRPDPNPVRGDLQGRRRTWGAFADEGDRTRRRAVGGRIGRIVGTAAPREPPRRSVASAAKRWVGLYDAAEDQIAIMGWDGLGQPAHPSFPRSEGLSGAAVATGQVVIVGDVAGDPRFLNTHATTPSEIVVPVLEREAVVGLIDVSM